MALANWRSLVTLHNEVDWGKLDEREFTANIWDVIKGDAPRIFNDPVLFFQSTYLHKSLLLLLQDIYNRLSGKDTSDSVIELQTGFGGGKTHNLIAAYHMTKYFEKIYPIIKETGLKLADQTLKANIAVYHGFSFSPYGTSFKGTPMLFTTPWQLIFYQLGGDQILKDLDQYAYLVPPEDLLIELLKKCSPALILLDEIAWSIDTLQQVKGKKDVLQPNQIANFLEILVSAVSHINNSVIVYTLPLKQSEFGSVETQVLVEQMNEQIEARVHRVGRPRLSLEGTDIYGVIQSRLFREIKKDFVDVIEEYKELYRKDAMEIVGTTTDESKVIRSQKKKKGKLNLVDIENAEIPVSSEIPIEHFPSRAHQPNYWELLKFSYPFHPEVIEIIRTHWANLPKFQSTRDILRLLATILTALVESNHQGSLILLRDIPLYHNLVQAFIQNLNLDRRLLNALQIDISSPQSQTKQLDDQFPDSNIGLARGTASAIFLWSGGIGKSYGATTADLFLASVSPNNVTINDVQLVLDKLVGPNGCYYIHKILGKDSEPTRYQFIKNPKLNRLIRIN